MHLTVVTLFVRLLSEATWSVICSDLCVFRTFQFCLTIIYLLRNIIPSRKKKALPREMFTPEGEPTTEQSKDTSKVQLGEHITAQPSGSPDGEPQQVRGCPFCESLSAAFTVYTSLGMEWPSKPSLFRGLPEGFLLFTS